MAFDLGALGGIRTPSLLIRSKIETVRRRPQSSGDLVAPLVIGEPIQPCPGSSRSVVSVRVSKITYRRWAMTSSLSVGIGRPPDDGLRGQWGCMPVDAPIGKGPGCCHLVLSARTPAPPIAAKHPAWHRLVSLGGSSWRRLTARAGTTFGVGITRRLPCLSYVCSNRASQRSFILRLSLERDLARELDDTAQARAAHWSL
jgi:hypothetical protein